MTYSYFTSDISTPGGPDCRYLSDLESEVKEQATYISVVLSQDRVFLPSSSNFRKRLTKRKFNGILDVLLTDASTGRV